MKKIGTESKSFDYQPKAIRATGNSDPGGSDWWLGPEYLRPEIAERLARRDNVESKEDKDTE